MLDQPCLVAQFELNSIIYTSKSPRAGKSLPDEAFHGERSLRWWCCDEINLVEKKQKGEERMGVQTRRQRHFNSKQTRQASMFCTRVGLEIVVMNSQVAVLQSALVKHIQTLTLSIAFRLTGNWDALLLLHKSIFYLLTAIKNSSERGLMGRQDQQGSERRAAGHFSFKSGAVLM